MFNIIVILGVELFHPVLVLLLFNLQISLFVIAFQLFRSTTSQNFANI